MVDFCTQNTFTLIPPESKACSPQHCCLCAFSACTLCAPRSGKSHSPQPLFLAAAQMPRVGPFLNCSQADTKSPSTVMGTVPRTMPSIKASTVAATLTLLPTSNCWASMASMAWAICGTATTPAAATAPRSPLELGAATKALLRKTAASRLKAMAGRIRRAMASS